MWAENCKPSRFWTHRGMKNAKIMDLGRPGPAPNSNIRYIFLHFSKMVFWSRFKFQYLVTFFSIFQKWCFGAVSNSNIWLHFSHFSQMVFWSRFKFQYLVTFFPFFCQFERPDNLNPDMHQKNGHRVEVAPCRVTKMQPMS